MTRQASNIQADLLFELGTEELPPRALDRLARALFEEVTGQLNKAGIRFDAQASRWLATPRRLAFYLAAIDRAQPDRTEERRGPALQAAFDEQGAPTPAALGFARSCGVAVDALEKRETPKGAWLYYTREVAGQPLEALLQNILPQALDKLPIPKRMRWGAHDFQFVRPVHWLVCLLDEAVLPLQLFGLEAGRKSQGHRFMHQGTVRIERAQAYESTLEQAFVQVCPRKRRESIIQQAEQLAGKQQARVILNPDVLEEVVNLVEWPVALLGRFDPDFLSVPPECLITSMEEHQRFFPLTDGNDQLLPAFITIANIASRQPEVVIQGNEKVIRPRLADARFFWDSDRKNPLASYQPRLAEMVFQQKLGTLLDKTHRLENLTAALAGLFQADAEKARRAAGLCKCDLVTDMVYEFTELQGIMGKYYALESGEPQEVAQAIEDHYHPRFAGDSLPQTPSGRALALADRLDTLCGIFAIGQKPTGNKDPFALRRAALGVIRLLIENQVSTDIQALLETALDALPITVENRTVLLEELQGFLLERLRGYLAEQSLSHGVIEAVLQVQSRDYFDSFQRAQALQALQGSEAMQSLAQANKRINNILKKQGVEQELTVNPERLQAEDERVLHATVEELRPAVQAAQAQRDYGEVLQLTARLQTPVNAFFDQVMVMADDPELRQNRLALLQDLQGLLHAVGDLSRLG